MTASDELMIEEAEAILKDCLRLCYLSVGREIQEDAVRKLDALWTKIEARRLERIAARSESEANLAWIAGCYISGLRQFLQMWIYSKSDDMEAAWDSLVSAESQLETALRLRFSEGFNAINRNLHALEQLLFPPCMFVSSSILVERFDCSICAAEYGECDHLAGKLYMGEMCAKVAKNVYGIDHVALVNDPQDKRLRLPTFSSGKDVCSLTFRDRGDFEQAATERSP